MQAEEDVEEGEIPSNEKEGSDGGEDCDQARGHLKTDGMERAAGKKRSGHQFEGAAHPHGDHGAHAAKKARPDGTQGPSVADGGRKGKKKQKFLDVYGSDARADLVLKMNEKRNNRLKMKDIQDLILWVLGERESPGSPNWVFIKNKPLVSKVVVVLLHGLGSHHYYHCAELFPNLKRCCGEPVALDGIGDTISALATAKALITIAPSKTMQKKLKKEEERSKAMARQQLSQPFDLSKVPGPLSQYLLKEEDMRLFNFPMATLDEEGKSVLPEGFVKTRSLLETGGQLAPDRELVSMDCEMCYTKNGLEVTRATLVDARGKVLYDKLVLPDDPITDYNTRYSGITAKMMENVTNRVADVQREFLDLISAETILVGHSLENDLKCIKMLHDRIIDTSVLYKHPRGGTHKFALRQLAANYLERYIQSGNHGHDSVEDAVAALDLVRLKLMNGPSFGNFHDESAGRNLMDALHADTGKACVMVDRGRGLHTYGARTASSICCETDKQVLDRAKKQVESDSIDFVWARFINIISCYDAALAELDTDAARAQAAARETCSNDNEVAATAGGGKATGSAAGDGAAPSQAIRGDEQEYLWENRLPPGIDAVFKEADRCIGELWESMPPNSIFLVVTGHGDTSKVRKMKEMKEKLSLQTGNRRASWDLTKENCLQLAASRALNALAFFGAKK